jgi:membrane-bound lytic murein transglycosylase F
MLTLDGPISYYLWRGELMGFDYELGKRFADSANLELEVVVAPSVSHLVPWLMEGRADLIAATLTITPEREKQGVAFTRPYLEVNEVIVSHVDAPPVASIDALKGRRVFVNPGTSHFTTANRLRDSVDLEVVSVDRRVEDLILGVAMGEINLTIADDHVAEVEAHFQDDLRIDLVVSGGHGLGWAVKKEHTELLGALDNFIRREYRGKHHGVLRNKYFRSEARFKGLRSDRIVGERLSPFDEQVKALAAQYGFDWRLIVAQMYQESRFDPEVRSRAGARGLLQVVPRTARELGVDPGGLADPVTGLEAGVRYLAWTRERFPDDVPVLDRMWFALAAYNAGPGHVFDARILARREGWDADRWFGDVDKAMLLLGKREYASKARHGWVRGREPVNYVASIRDRYQAYVDHFEQLEARSVTGYSNNEPVSR